MEIAQEILRQLGGKRFTMMTGAKDYVGGENALKFRLPGGKFMSITLNDRDLYDLCLYRVSRKTWTDETVSETGDVHVDSLHATFTKMTGLYTRL